ncbi:MAG: hypothetical protein HY901_35880 [Deltaproteobacteria bacterium]|nr:hypothetical protein [Deltaproteobacteria bacterium]
MNREAALACGLVLLAPAVAYPCGPEFPVRLFLVRGPALLTAPPGSLEAEMKAVEQTSTPAFPVVAPAASLSAQVLEADLSDLRMALRKSGARPEAICEAGLALKKLRGVANDSLVADTGTDNLELVPEEFVDYVAGAVAWTSGDGAQAIGRWQELLAKPAGKRPYRSTWAAFMLGKAFMKADSEKSIAWFQTTRKLASQGFVDTLGLAETSLGWEAQVEHKRGHHAQAARLYARQWALGNPGGLSSLQYLAKSLVEGSDAELLRVVRDPDTRTLVTAWLLTRSTMTLGNAWKHRNPKAARWLSAVEATQLRELPGADRLAWLAYRYGSFELARRWLALAAPESAMTMWLSAKLAAMDGEFAKAEELLTRTMDAFPEQEEWILEYPEAEALGYQMGRELRPRSRAQAERAVLQTRRNAFVNALDSAVRAGYWLDAAYLAERVVGLDELKTYVDAQWPVKTMAEGERETFERFGRLDPASNHIVPANGHHPRLRALLGRRLAREGRGEEARSYLPPSQVPQLEAYLGYLAVAERTEIEVEERAMARWRAAKIVRKSGMEILGTELAPDWATEQGSYDVSEYDQGFREGFKELLPPGRDRLGASVLESEKSARSAPRPDRRFHYRYLASKLAAEAARALPKESEAAAIIYCWAVGWIIDHDQKGARAIWREYTSRGKLWPWGGAAFGRGCPAQPE